MNTVHDLGEFAFIERLKGILGPGSRPDIIVGIGDDAAVYRFGDEYLVATTDTMVEGVHFLSQGADWEAIGWKAMAVNISDIAAMGGWPLFALVTLALPPETNMHAMDKLYEGLRDSGRICGVYIIGGDVVRASEISITVAVIGRAEQRDGEPLLLRRDAAKPGDLIAVTGALGDSAGGLRRLKAGAEPDDPLVHRHLRPSPRLAEAGIAAGVGVRCGIDVSDGLLQDIGHICERSRAGAVVRAADVPLSDDLRTVYPDDALQLACTGGEDYELVLVGDEAALRELMSELPDARITVIGEIIEDRNARVRLLDESGAEIRYERSGWDAFR